MVRTAQKENFEVTANAVGGHARGHVAQQLGQAMARCAGRADRPR